MTIPKEAVILAAGLGSRFGRPEDIKPLATLGGLGLVERNARLMQASGLERLVLVTGFHHDVVEQSLGQALEKYDLSLRFIHNPEFEKKNGISALLGGKACSGPFLLLMADHVFDHSILHDALSQPAPTNGGILYVDRQVDGIYDLTDATKVQTASDGRVIAIGKHLHHYDCIDIGLFVLTADFTGVLEKMYREIGDCSLSDGVQALADLQSMHVRDIGMGRWQDVDTIDALEHARRLFETGVFDPSSPT